MKTRVLSGLAMVPLLALVYLGGYPLLALCVIIAVIGIKEFYDGFNAMGIKPCHLIAYASVCTVPDKCSCTRKFPDDMCMACRKHYDKLSVYV